MIGYIKGILTDREEDQIILENHGIGFRIRIPGRVQDSLPAMGAEIQLYTYMQVREDDLSLFGFLTKDDLNLFRMLLTVSGVGPKGALGILSVLSGSELRIAVHTQDAKMIAKAPGVGGKTAQRVIIDLKDRLKLEDAWELDETNHESGNTNRTVQTETIEALTALGYSPVDAAAAVRRVNPSEEMSVEECLKQSLKYML